MNINLAKDILFHADLPDLELDEDDEMFSHLESEGTNVTSNKTDIEEGSGDSNTDIVNEQQTGAGAVKKLKSGTMKKTAEKKKWSQKESTAVLGFFRTFVKQSKSAPGKKLCEECIESTDALTSRTWRDVKYFVYNHIKRIEKGQKT